MSSYVGKYADYYNVIYAEKPYAAEAAFVHERLQRHSGGQTARLLELACGTGRHAFELERLGYQILATDYSKDLLAVAQHSAAQQGSTVKFDLQDMRALRLGEQVFDAAYCLFDSIGYVQTNAAVLDVLRGVKPHLRPGGLLVLEFWHAAAMLRAFEPYRERTWALPGGTLARTSQTRLDIPNQLAHVHYTLKETTPAGTVETEETQTNRFFLVQEMSLFLEQAGYQPLEWAPAYEPAGEITADTWHVLVVARNG